MKLDDLISKYLDGELSYDEDIHLRNLLKNNPDTKAEFDSAVLINSAIREDAQSIQASQDFLKNTEDLVLMRILSANEPAVAQKEKRKLPLWLPGLSFMFALFMIATLYFITNTSNTDSVSNSRALSLNNPSSQQQQNNPNLSDDFSDTTKQNTSTPKSHSPKVFVSKYNKDSQIAQILSESNSKLSESFSSNDILSDAISYNLYQPAINSKIVEDSENISKALSSNNYSNEKLLTTSNASSFTLFSSRLLSSNFANQNNQIKLNPNANINLSFLENFTTPVILSTLYTANSINKNAKTISSLSQSIAYNCTEDVALGIEFGYTEYNYDRTTMIKVPFTNGSLNSKVEIGNNHDQSSEYVYIPINLAQNYKQYWVSTFMDYDVFDYERISLNTRIGAGLSGNGAMFYSRLISDVELFNGVYLKFGGEIKSFEGLVLNAKTKYITTGSLIYGIKLKLY